VPARKRRTRSRRARRSKRAWHILLIAAPVVLLIAGVYWHERGPKRPTVTHPSKITAPKPPARAPAGGNPAALGKLVERYNAIVIGSGGESAWLKRPARPDDSPADSSAARARGEALVLAPAVPAILADLKQQAAQDGFHVDVRQADARSDTLPDLEIALARSKQHICTWELHRVPRLYRAAIVIDDLGQDMQPTRALLALPYPLTFSILPHLPASRETSAAAALAGRDVILHLPMEPSSDKVSPG